MNQIHRECDQNQNLVKKLTIKTFGKTNQEKD